MRRNHMERGPIIVGPDEADRLTEDNPSTESISETQEEQETETDMPRNRMDSGRRSIIVSPEEAARLTEENPPTMLRNSKERGTWIEYPDETDRLTEDNPPTESTSETQEEQEIKTENGEYLSSVTEKYFEDWDDLELIGNPGIKERIKKNIIESEKRLAHKYQAKADQMGVSIEEFKAALQAKVENMLEKANFFRATTIEVLDQVMNVDGRWKSQFETNTSNGSLSPSYRSAHEEEMFGFTDDVDANKELRPIYGYFSDNSDGVINYEGRIPPPNNVNYYGTINFKIKKDRTLNKSTVTFQDSLAHSNILPSPAAKPHFTSFALLYWETDEFKSINMPSVTNWGAEYTEVQYHEQLTMDDVESIHICPDNNLSAADIEYIRRTFAKYKEQHPDSTIELIEF